MNLTGLSIGFRTWIGAFAGPALWFLQQQLAYWRLPGDCHASPWVTMAIWLICTASLLVAAYISARQLRANRENAREQRLFTAALAIGLPLIFLIPMTWQAFGGLLYAGCEQ